MAALAIREPPAALGERSTLHLFEPGGASLEDLVVGVWDELVTQGRADCPVCGDSMSPAAGCSGCGSELS